VQHVLERRLHRDPILFGEVRVEAGTHDVDLHRAARNGRLNAGGHEFCGAHRSYNTAVAFCGCETL
jgi:hypothetical protein